MFSKWRKVVSTRDAISSSKFAFVWLFLVIIIVVCLPRITIHLGWVVTRVNSTRWEEPWPLGDDKLIIDRAYFLNQHHQILNEARYGVLTEGKQAETNVKAVIVVQVHDRLQYLRYLLESLAMVVGIEHVLIVFSHDLVSPPINQLIRNVTFARVIQLLYPYNLQLFPDRFPGQSLDDCPEYVKGGPTIARRIGCKNWAYPGSEQRYRKASYAQLKHHHWWKLNYIFDGIVKRYGIEKDSIVLLLEEDEVVAPDLLHVLDLMTRERARVCPDCQILSLGNTHNLPNATDLQLYKNNGSNFSIRRGEYYRGLAINWSWWQQFRGRCAEAFCTQDEYSLHWTLYHLGGKENSSCMPLWEMRIDMPRIIHVGDCGMHQVAANNCDKYSSTVVLARRIFVDQRDALFPRELHFTGRWNTSSRPDEHHGGWGDPRDHALCRLNNNPAEHPISSKQRNIASHLFRT